MGTSPVAILVIIAIYAVFFAVIDASAPAPEEATAPTLNQSDCDAGINNVCGLGEIISFVFNIIEFFTDILTFNVEGAPVWIRVPISVAITGSIVWAVITLIRGTEG